MSNIERRASGGPAQSRPNPFSGDMNEDIECLSEMPINDIAGLVHANAINHGFHPQGQSEGDWLAHMCCNKHGEVSELYEAYRCGKLREPCDKADKMVGLGLPALSCLEEELADLIIRALDESQRLGVDIARAVAVKHLYNLTRPYKHGRLS